MASKKTRKAYDPLLSTPQLPTFGTVPIIPHSLGIVFRLSRPRTWVFPSTGFLLGYTLTGWGPLTQIGIGLAVACLITAATNIVNAYADRNEDAVNQPSRVFWLDRIGRRGAVASSILLYGTAIALAVQLGTLFLLVLSLGVFNSLFYSLRPLRFKARPLPSLLSFSGAVGLAFLSGLAARGTLDPFSPLLLLTAYFMLTYGTVKNLPDYQGDKKAGTRTSATVFQNIKHAILFSGALLYTPYILLTTLVAAKLLKPIYLLDLGFAVLLTLIFSQMWKAKNPQDLERVHTFGFFYAISFLLFTLVLTNPSLESVTAISAAFLWTMLVSKVNVDSRVENRDWEKSRGKQR